MPDTNGPDMDIGASSSSVKVTLLVGLIPPTAEIRATFCWGY